MPDNEGAAPETPESQPTSIEGLWNNAEAAASTSDKPSSPPEGQAEQAEQPAPAPAPEPEPEHVQWAKRAQGFVNPETGQLDQDRILKQAFENHKTWQRIANENAQVRRILEHPQVAAAVQQAWYGQAPAQPAKPAEPQAKEELTDEEQLDRYVTERAKKVAEPLNQQVQILLQKNIAMEKSNVQMRLSEAFGKDEAGAPVIDSIGNEIVQVMGQVAAQNNIPLPQLVDTLALQGRLYDTLSTVAGNLLYQRQLAAKAAPAPAGAPKAVPAKPAPSPPSRTSAPAKAPRKITSFAEATAAAEEELAKKGLKFA